MDFKWKRLAQKLSSLNCTRKFQHHIIASFLRPNHVFCVNGKKTHFINQYDKTNCLSFIEEHQLRRKYASSFFALRNNKHKEKQRYKNSNNDEQQQNNSNNNQQQTRTSNIFHYLAVIALKAVFTSENPDDDEISFEPEIFLKPCSDGVDAPKVSVENLDDTDDYHEIHSRAIQGAVTPQLLLTAHNAPGADGTVGSNGTANPPSSSDNRALIGKILSFENWLKLVFMLRLVDEIMIKIAKHYMEFIKNDLPNKYYDTNDRYIGQINRLLKEYIEKADKEKDKTGGVRKESPPARPADFVLKHMMQELQNNEEFLDLVAHIGSIKNLRTVLDEKDHSLNEEEFKERLKYFADLRNDMAHSTSLLRSSANVDEALVKLRELMTTTTSKPEILTQRQRQIAAIQDFKILSGTDQEPPPKKDRPVLEAFAHI